MQVFNAVAGYIHPKWTGIEYGYDVAVLKLDRDANLTLPRFGTSNVALNRGDLLAATGWGQTDSAFAAKKLRVATHLVAFVQDRCKLQPQGVDPNSWICAGGQHQDTDSGDLDSTVLYAHFF